MTAVMHLMGKRRVEHKHYAVRMVGAQADIRTKVMAEDLATQLRAEVVETTVTRRWVSGQGYVFAGKTQRVYRPYPVNF